MRRAVIARNRAGGSQFVLVTFTSQELRSDADMRAAFQRLLMWGRKYLGPWFEFYVWVAQLQQRGVLHFHLLLAKRIPKALFKRMRSLWADTYGMGPGSVDIVRLKSGKAAAGYMGRVMAYFDKGPRAYRVGLDGEGSLSWESWPVGRNGEAYERVEFHGRGGDMSRAARVYAGVRVELWADWGAFPSLPLVGRSWFMESPQAAEELLSHLLSGGSPPVKVAPIRA
jgi:hypothetical protein